MMNFLKTQRKRYREKFLTPVTSSDNDNTSNKELIAQPNQSKDLDQQMQKEIFCQTENEKDPLKISQFLCVPCQKSFSTKSNLNKHSKKYHSQILIPSKEHQTDIETTKRLIKKRKFQNFTDLDKKEKISEQIKFIPKNSQINFLLNSNKCDSSPKSQIKKESQEFSFLDKFHYNQALMIPIFYHIKQMATQKSKVKGMGLRISGSYTNGNYFCKIYNERSFVHEQNLQIRLQNEFAITKLSKEQSLNNLIRLENILEGQDHLGFAYKMFEMNFNQFLQFHFNPNLARSFLLQLTTGIKNLHSLGYSHRKLIPENIMVILKNPDLVIVNFKNSQLHSNLTIADDNTNQLFNPTGIKITIGNPQNDIFSMACFVIYTYMCKDFYCEIKNQEQFLAQAEGLLLDPKLCNQVRRIINNCLLEQNPEKWPNLQELRDSIVEMEFNQVNQNQISNSQDSSNSHDKE